MKIILLTLLSLLALQAQARDLSCQAVKAFSDETHTIPFTVIDDKITFTQNSVWGGFSNFETIYKVKLGREGLTIARAEHDSGKNYHSALELKLDYRTNTGTMNVGDLIHDLDSPLRMGKFREYTVECNNL